MLIKLSVLDPVFKSLPLDDSLDRGLYLKHCACCVSVDLLDGQRLLMDMTLGHWFRVVDLNYELFYHCLI